MPLHDSARRVSIARRLSLLRRDRDGSTALEMAFVLPVLLAFCFGIIEVGHLLWTITALNMAVQDAARCVSVSNVSAKNTLCSTQAKMQTYAASRTWGMSIPSTEFTLTQPACGYQVTASHPFVPIVSYIPMSITIQAQACFPQWQ